MTYGSAEVALATVVVAVAASLAGASGFGFSLIAAPLLLIAGLDAGPVVFTCLVLTAVTRLAVAIRFRAFVDRSSVAFLIAGSVPGLYIGARLITAANADLLRAVIGVTVMVAAAASFAFRSRQPNAPGRWRCVAAGFGGGLLGALAGLNGVVPALALTRSEVAPRPLFATLGVYAFVSAAIGLMIVLATTRIPLAAVGDAIAWTPVAVAGNAVGVAAGLRLSPSRIRQVALLVSFAAGAAAAASALR
jgi:uncharacterized protein